MYADATHTVNTGMISFVFSVLQADADEMQPQRLTTPELTAQDHALFHSSRSVVQPCDPVVGLIIRGADEHAGGARVP